MTLSQLYSDFRQIVQFPSLEELAALYLYIVHRVNSFMNGQQLVWLLVLYPLHWQLVLRLPQVIITSTFTLASRDIHHFLWQNKIAKTIFSYIHTPAKITQSVWERDLGMTTCFWHIYQLFFVATSTAFIRQFFTLIFVLCTVVLLILHWTVLKNVLCPVIMHYTTVLFQNALYFCTLLEIELYFCTVW